MLDFNTIVRWLPCIILSSVFISVLLYLNASENILTTNTSEKIPTSPGPTARPQSCNGCLSVQFEFLINNENICEPANESVDILILITSAPQNNLAREAIREI